MMLFGIALVLAAHTFLGLASPWIARVLAPWVATPLISVAAFATTLAGGFAVSVLCFDFVAQIPDVANGQRWSAHSLNNHGRIPLGLGITACLALLIVAFMLSRRASRVVGDLWSASMACRRLTPDTEHLVVVDDVRPDAYAVSGFLGGRVVVTSGMLSALDGDELRVLLAHEHSHLRHAHHVYLALAQVSAAASPLTRGLPRVVRACAERWADEDAASVTGSRPLAARALVRAGLETIRSDASGRLHTALGIADAQVAHRAMALLAPRPCTRPRGLVVVAVIAVLAMVGTLATAHSTEHRFEHAHADFVSP
jgi:beta-lactamase regulating signal transducer with metallopeptidase domain